MEGCLGGVWLGGWGHVIRENKKSTVVRAASNYTHTHTHKRMASNLAIRLLLRCHMGTVCAGRWPLGLSTNRMGWKDR